MRYFTRILALALFTALPATLAAQSSSSITASANVLAPLSVTPDQDLAFGNVLQGATETVAPADADAGRFQVQGTGNQEVTLDFGSLPAR